MITAAGRPVVLAVGDATVTGEARRAAAALAGNLGFDETGRGKAALVATEAATNLLKHATDGELVLQGIESGAAAGLDVLALDRGPGMADLGRCRADGYSTAGSPGTGLGALARVSDVFDVHSLPEVGTAALARLWSQPGAEAGGPAGLVFGAVSVPLAGEEVCGDAWAIEAAGGRVLVLVADGLGHGPQAAEAAAAAVRVFRESATLGPAELIHASHLAMKSTRGAALAVARIDRERGEVCFAGVGNVAGAVLDAAEDRSASMVSHNGTVGHTIRKVQEFTYPWSPGSLLVMSSDGLGTHWRLGRYAGLALRHPGLVAGALYRDFKRGRDDVTVVAVREGSATPR